MVVVWWWGELGGEGLEGGKTYVAENEEEDVEDGICRADAALYPDCLVVVVVSLKLW